MFVCLFICFSDASTGSVEEDCEELFSCVVGSIICRSARTQYKYIVWRPPVRRISYYFPLRVTELKQCLRSFNLFHMSVIQKPIYTEFNYIVSLISVDSDVGILFHLFEVRNNRATGGGSSFLEFSDAFRRQMCFYEHCFSSNYIIWCPWQM